MFTGIVAATGTIRCLTCRDGGGRLEVTTALALDDVRIGDGIAVNGSGLAVKAFISGGFAADVPAAILSRTTLKDLRTGTPVNLEKALRPGDRLGGHLVAGEVDGVGRIVELSTVSRSLCLGVEIDAGLARYVVEKGSIALDGVSLTVNRLEKSRFYVNVIPTTAALTTLGRKKQSDPVNIEADLLGRHVERLLVGGPIPVEDDGAAPENSAGIDAAFLARCGFLKG